MIYVDPVDPGLVLKLRTGSTWDNQINLSATNRVFGPGDGADQPVCNAPRRNGRFRPSVRLPLEACYNEGVSDIERQRDKARLDRLLDAWDRELQGEPDLETLVLASRSLPALLERRSKLLGLDATPESAGASAGQPSAVARILAAVPGKSGA